MRSLIRFFVSQSLFGNLLTAIVFIVGLYSVSTIRKDLFPPVEFDITLVTAILPGAAPDQVEKLLVNPLEEALREVDGVKKVQSSATDSRAVISLTLDPDARDPEKTNADIQRAVDRIEDYPSEAEKPIVLQLEAGQTPVVEISITDDSMDSLKLREFVKDIADEISLVSGVAKVTKSAWRKKEKVVELDPKVLSLKQVSIFEVIQSLKLSNIQLPAGDMILGSGREMAVKTDGEIRNLEELANTPVRKNFEGFGVRVKDIGTVYEGLSDPDILYRTNGKDSYSLIILKKSKADALKTLEAVKARVSEVQEKLPASIQVRYVNDFTEYLKNRLGTLGTNMVMGMILVALVLTLFLPWRVALVVATGIPFSMLAALAILKQMGFSMNLISMIGLIIVSGMLVDDAIIVVENIFRRLEGGEDFKTAVTEGTIEMFPAVTASVLTTVAAFSPMLFMSGIFGKFVFEIPVMVIVPLVVSLVEAFIVAPVHFNEWVGIKGAASIVDRTSTQSKKVHWYDGVLEKYKNFVVWSLDHRLKVFGAFLGLMVFTGGLAYQMKFILFPPDGVYSFFVRLDGPPGLSLENMKALMAEIEPEIYKLPKEELRDFITQVGIQQNEPDDPFTKRASHYGQILVNLTPENERKRTVSEVVEDLRSKIKKPEVATKLHFEILKGGPPQGKPISVNVMGDDFSQIRQVVALIKKELSQVEGVTDIDDSEVLGKKEVKIVPRSSDLARLGLTTQDVATTVRASYAGIVATSTRNLDEEIDIRVKLKPLSLSPEEQFRVLAVGNQMGNLIPIHRISDFQTSDSQLLIQHEKYKRVITVGAQVDLEKTTALEATARLQERLRPVIEQHKYVKIEYGGENEDTEESMQSLLRAFGFAGLLIFSILILTFGSFSQPFLVLLAIPMGFAGTVIGLFIHGKPISFMAMLGIIALAGVIVNNAIVVIDFYNSRLKAGLAWREAIVEASCLRLRPIILTSVTTVLGLMPTAYGIGGNDGFVAALALALGWGLMIGSVLTMLVFPALLATLEGFKHKN